jgi:hypothetical protein
VTFTNLTTSESATYLVSLDNNGIGSSAEWIIEQHCSQQDAQGTANHICPPVAYDDPQFADAYTYGTRMSMYLDYFRYRRVDLTTEDNQLLAKPTSADRSTHGFSVLCCNPTH